MKNPALVLSALLTIGGCAAPKCAPTTTIVKQMTVEKETPPKIVYVQEPQQRGYVLEQIARDSQPAQDKIAAHGSLPDLQKLISLRYALKKALIPLSRKRPAATDAQVRTAINAYAALNAWVSTHSPRK